MIYYQVLPERKLPVRYLTYSSEQELVQGQVVKINLRNKVCWGLILDFLDHEEVFDKEKIKPISELVPIKLTKQQINFLFSFAFNSFNSPNDVLAAMLKPLQMLSQKYWTEIEENKIEEQKPKTETELSISNPKKANKDKNILSTSANKNAISQNDTVRNSLNLEIVGQNISLRIRYIIRSLVNNHLNDSILVIFPEKKQLYQALEGIDRTDNELAEKKTNIYTAEKNIESQKTVVNLLTQKSNLVFGTRQSLFLPWKTIDQIILVDEASSFYIQDQNQLYFDAREASFLFSQNFGANLNLLSTLPSVRLYNFYSDKISEGLLNKKSVFDKKSLKIKLLSREQKGSDFNQLLDSLENESTQVVDDSETKIY